MKKNLLFLAISIFAISIYSCTNSGTDDPMNPNNDPNIWGNWTVNSVDYSTEIDIFGTVFPIEGTSTQEGSMELRADNTCTYNIRIKTEDTVIPNVDTIPGVEIDFMDSGTYTFERPNDQAVTRVVITNSMGETLDFQVQTDQANTQVWETTTEYDTTIPFIGVLDIDLTLNMTK